MSRYRLASVETWVLAILMTKGAQCPVDIRVNVIDRFKLDATLLPADLVQAALAGLTMQGDVFCDPRFQADRFVDRPHVDPATRIRYDVTDKFRRGYKVERALDQRLGALKRFLPAGS